MKIVFHPDFHRVYTPDPASARGRLAPAEKALCAAYETVTPVPIDPQRLELVHTRTYLAEVKGMRKVWPLALLAAGATLEAGRIAAGGEPAFALVRPPGHHASPDSGWGFCFANNVAVAVASLIDEGSVGSAVILDIDLHFGDGTDNAFRTRSDVTYLHPEGPYRDSWMEQCRKAIDEAPDADIVAVSAGFDRHAEDWGGTLFTEDYAEVGQWVSERWERRFAVLEGGYNADSLAEAALALCDAIRD